LPVLHGVALSRSSAPRILVGALMLAEEDNQMPRYAILSDPQTMNATILMVVDSRQEAEAIALDLRNRHRPVEVRELPRRVEP
jgi:hypothetical protein